MIREKQQDNLTWERTKAKIAKWKQDLLAEKKTAEISPQTSNFATRISSEEPVIRKMVLEPSGFASFNKDLEDEIDMTNLKDCVLVEYHSYLNIFS